MNKAKLLLKEYHVDKNSGCKYRFVDSGSERFVLHYHEYYELFLTLDDNIVHIVNGVKQVLKRGSLVFIRPCDEHTFEYSDKIFRFVNLTFDTESIEKLFDFLSDAAVGEQLISCKMPPEVLLSEKECIRLFEKLEELNAVRWNDAQRLKTQMRIILFDIFVRYFRNYKTEENDNTPLWLNDMTEKMKKPENFIVGINKMTELSGKTKEHISRCMKHYLGTTPTDYINDLRINYAANRLINSGDSVTKICYDSGFMNISWFYEYFRKKYSMSPKEFRIKYKSL